MLSAKKNIKYHFWVFGMTRPEIEPWSPGPLANTRLIRPMAGLKLYRVQILRIGQEYVKPYNYVQTNDYYYLIEILILGILETI